MARSEKQAGKLYLCPTPIGNLQDITLRVLETLKSCDLVAAENLGVTKKLFARHSIGTPMVSYREENRKKAGARIIERIREGEDVALVSDAGTPGLSDPGYHLVSDCVENDIEVVPLPGPAAAVTALVASGLPTRRFVFEGFLPRKKGARRRKLEELAREPRTLVFYESPSRLDATLEDLQEVMGDRRITVAREMTKKFEEIVRGAASEVRRRLEGRLKGEMVLVVEGAAPGPLVSEDDAIEEVMRLHGTGLSLREAVDQVAGASGLSRRELYNLALKQMGRP